MGFRTVVVLHNDRAHEWSKDPNLGEKIQTAMNRFQGERGISYGSVLECVHADTQTAAIIDSYRIVPLTHSQWRRDESEHDMKVRLVRDAARELGYDLHKRRKG